MGINTSKIAQNEADICIRLLQNPFDFASAFDQALKQIVVAIPNRPAKESSEDAVCEEKTLGKVT